MMEDNNDNKEKLITNDELLNIIKEMKKQQSELLDILSRSIDSNTQMNSKMLSTLKKINTLSTIESLSIVIGFMLFIIIMAII